MNSNPERESILSSVTTQYSSETIFKKLFLKIRSYIQRVQTKKYVRRDVSLRDLTEIKKIMKIRPKKVRKMTRKTENAKKRKTRVSSTTLLSRDSNFVLREFTTSQQKKKALSYKLIALQ